MASWSRLGSTAHEALRSRCERLQGRPSRAGPGRHGPHRPSHHARAAVARLELSVVHGDADRPGQLAAWVHGHEVVFDAAAPYPMNLFVRDGAADRAPRAHAQRRMGQLLQAVGREGAVLVHVAGYTALRRPAGVGALAALEARARRRLHPYLGSRRRYRSRCCRGPRICRPWCSTRPRAWAPGTGGRATCAWCRCCSAARCRRR